MFWSTLWVSTRCATSSVIDASSATRSGAEQRPSRTGLQQDLDVDLVVGGVHPGGVVDEVGVDPATRPGVLDATPLGPAQIAALAGHRRPHLGAVDAHRVVGLVTDVGVGLIAALT
jgi:hypothetical protein